MGQLAELVSIQMAQNAEGTPNDSPLPLSKLGGTDIVRKCPRTHNEPAPMRRVQRGTHRAVDPCLESLRKEGYAVNHKGERVAVERKLLQLHGRKVPRDVEDALRDVKYASQAQPLPTRLVCKKMLIVYPTTSASSLQTLPFAAPRGDPL